jgi:hypothetical protein
MPQDPRIPVTFLADAAALEGWLATGGPAALLTDGAFPPAGPVAAQRFAPGPAHRIGCACCAGRTAAAIALDRLFQARVRDPGAWFERVGALLATAGARLQLRAALEADPLTRARFRPA